MARRCILFAGQDLFVGIDEPQEPFVSEAAIAGLSASSIRDFDWEGEEFTALGIGGDVPALAEARGMSRLPVRKALSLWPLEVLRPVLKGMALVNWLEGARHCGACGAEFAGSAPPDLSGPELDGALVCPSCGRAHFPRISPAVIVLVRKGDKALLARNARFPPGGRFGLLAGFVEAGETIEEAAAREVREEARVEIRNLRYVRSQPWPFPDSLMFAFTAEWASGEARPDGVEIAELKWCGPDELPEIPFRGSVARELIEDFVAAAAREGGSETAPAQPRAETRPELRAELRAGPMLVTDRLVLRGPEAGDAPSFLEFVLRNRDFLAPWEPVRPPEYFTIEGVSRLMEELGEANRSRSALHLLLVEREGGAIVGSLSASNIVYRAFQSCTLGYRLGADRIGNGYMTEAIRAAAAALFGDYGLHRIEANVMPRNLPSRRLLERAGFEEEGMSKAYLRIAGKWEDHIHYVLLAEER